MAPPGCLNTVPLARFGLIDMRAQAEALSARRPTHRSVCRPKPARIDDSSAYAP